MQGLRSRLRRGTQLFFPAASFAAPFTTRRVRIGSGVVLVAVNLAALAILLMLDLVVLSGRQMAAIGRAIAACLVVDGGFVVLDVRSFTLRELPGMNSLIDAILLAILARVHAHPFRMSRSPVVHRRIIAAIDAGVILMRDLIVCAPDMLLAASRRVRRRLAVARMPPSPLKL